MRRFEFVEGTSAKFWMADVEANNFVVVYGRLGTAGQRKDKAFPNEAAARKELEKKIAEKVREGYHEVSADAATQAPPGAKGAAAAAPKLELPPRLAKREKNARVDPAHVRAAVEALRSLESELGSRSWAVSHRARKARRALEALGGFDPARDDAMATVFDALMTRAVARSGERRLQFREALGLLSELDAAALTRAAGAWRNVDQGNSAAPSVRAFLAPLDAFGEPELALRLGLLLTARPSNPAEESAWKKRWSTLKPHVDLYLSSRGEKLQDVLRAVEPGNDTHLARRIDEMRA